MKYDIDYLVTLSKRSLGTIKLSTKNGKNRKRSAKNETRQKIRSIRYSSQD